MQENSRKSSTSALLTTLKPLTVWVTTNCGKYLKRWEYQITLPASWETCMQLKKQQLKLDMEQMTDSKLGKQYVKVIYYHPAWTAAHQAPLSMGFSRQEYWSRVPSPSPYMQSTSCEILGWLKHKLESRLPGEISTTSDKQMAAF